MSNYGTNITVKDKRYADAVRAANNGSDLSVRHVAALFGVSEALANRWARERPEFRAWQQTETGRNSAWNFPVEHVEEVLGFKIRVEA